MSTTMSGPHATKDPTSPLLRLPPVLRHRIYRFVGLASWNPDGSPYTFDLRGRDCASDRASGGGWVLLQERQPSPHMFRGLLLSCRAIHAEAAALLYSANRFIVHYTNPGSLAPLLSLTPPALSSLRALKIVLNQASCHHRTQSSTPVVLHVMNNPTPIITSTNPRYLVHLLGMELSTTRQR